MSPPSDVCDTSEPPHSWQRWDDNLGVALTSDQAEVCALLVAACVRGHEDYRDALPDVARLLMVAAVNARAGLGGDEPDVTAAWAAVAKWPPPAPGPPRR